MQSSYPAQFRRDQGCSTAEWLGWLPRAVGPHALALQPGQRAEVALPPGRLCLAWEVLPPRQWALLSLPRLQVDYRFEGVDDEARLRFMRHFDLIIQRGGG